jgi:hypothetical protein
MSRKLLPLKHHLSSGCCMWSGIEDVYATMTNQTLPEAFFFGLSSFGESAYINTGDKDRPYMFSIVDGRTRKTYDRIKDILGLTYQISQGRTLSYALTSIKKEIDSGNPVILGPLDMYYLPYLKMYHQFHIPIHYIVMVGYDDDKDCILIYDCDRPELIELPLQDLIQAWQIQKNPVGDKHGFIRFSLSDHQLMKYELAKTCLQKKAQRQLCQKPNFIGINAYHKIARELPHWKDNYTQAEFKNILSSLVEYFGRVPKLPNEILGIDSNEDISYQANYDRLGNILVQLGDEFDQSEWRNAGKLFHQCGLTVEAITNYVVKYVCYDEDCLSKLPGLFVQIGNDAERAYQLIMKSTD